MCAFICDRCPDTLQFKEMNPRFVQKAKQLKTMKTDLDACFGPPPQPPQLPCKKVDVSSGGAGGAGFGWCWCWFCCCCFDLAVVLRSFCFAASLCVVRIRKIKEELNSRFPNALARSEAETHETYTKHLKQKGGA